MLDNALRAEDLGNGYVIMHDAFFRAEDKDKYKQQFEFYHNKGTILSDFNDDKWMCFSDVLKKSLNFSFNEKERFEYGGHTKRILGYTPSELKDVMKYFILFTFEDYILATLQDRIKAIKRFVIKYGDDDYKATEKVRTWITEFLIFAGLSLNQAEMITSRIRKAKEYIQKQRTLKDYVNYLSINEEISYIYLDETGQNLQDDISDEDYIRWFPVFFWCKVTFILPLRATEMILTPFDCITVKDDDTVLFRIRRTRLKKKRHNVKYMVEEDYKIYEYTVPHNVVVDAILKYQRLTKDHSRRFLFDYGERFVNKNFSLQGFNRLLEKFVTERLVGNRRYDFTRYAAGIEEFTPVTAGDSRPIAMSQLYFQDNSAEICRQLADHEDIDVSAGYYTNVSNTIEASSIIQIQRELNAEKNKADTERSYYEGRMATNVDDVFCTSPKRILDKENIEDCIEQNHISDCLGCVYFMPTDEILEKEYKERRKKAEDACRTMFKCFADRSRKKDSYDYDALLLKVQTKNKQYEVSCDAKARKELREWRRHINMTTIDSLTQ